LVSSIIAIILVWIRHCQKREWINVYFNDLKDNRKAFKNELNYYYNEAILEIDDADERYANRASLLLEKRSSFDWTLLFEVVLLCIIPNPFYDHYFITFYGIY
tara:strand:+ start:51 stop:359 length:309 start_codon:yes stop_codon:yes gene_type:complete